MKHWQETSRILRLLPQFAEQGRKAAIATVIRIEGSAYRRPGAKMLITDDGAILGSVSGGCLEADVREVALSLIQNGVPRLLRYDTGTDYQLPFGLGLGCNGSVEIFVQPVTSTSLLGTVPEVTRVLEKDDRFAVCTIVRGPRDVGRGVVVTTLGKVVGSTGDKSLDQEIAARASDILEGDGSEVQSFGTYEIFVDLQVPPPSLVVFGAGDDTRPLARCAIDVGFRVTVVDHRPAYLSADKYPPEVGLIEARAKAAGSGRADALLSDRADVAIPGVLLGPKTYAVVKTHSLEHDCNWVARLLATNVPYIGILGPRTRTDEILRELRRENDERIFGPVGLNIGAEGPEQIAVSIVAELLAVVSSREPTHLREKQGAIHAVEGAIHATEGGIRGG
ncbi:MAG: XdhC family protein [Gemmatimonadaceae bacterium]